MPRFFLASILSLALFTSLVQAPVAYAQVDTGLNEVGQNINLPDTDPRVIAARIINIALGFVGILLVIIILYAGFLYMTSGGDEEKTRKALAYIRNAIIGLIIVLMSWGIARFVIERLMDATGSGGSGGAGGGGGGGGGGFENSGGSQPFAIVSITPNGPVSTRKVIVKIVFSRAVSETSAATTGAIVVERADGQRAEGTVVVNGRVVTFTSSTPCPAPNEDRRCLEENTDYRVRVGSSLEATTGQRISCGGFSPSCEGTFRTGTEVDVTPPEVSMTYPSNGQSVPANSLVDLVARVRDQTGIAYVSFQEGSFAIGESAPVDTTPTSFDARVQWDTAGLAVGSEHALSATAYDVDSGVATSPAVSVVVRAAHCFNGTQDAGETGLDCGGPQGSAEYCGACAGSSCTGNGQCSSGFCSAGSCVEQPRITSVTPQDGAVGTYVTLQGANFGNTGRVTFLGASEGAAVDAVIPSACLSTGSDTWSPTQVVVEVPPGAQNGPIRLTNGGSGLSDVTNAPPDPALPDFLVNNTLRPGLCAAEPEEGSSGQLFRLIGARLGNVSSPILFGDRTLTSSSWTDAQAEALVPNIAAGTAPVAVRTSGGTSNPLHFVVRSATAVDGPPQIAAIEPSSGPIGTYVTLSGENFGMSVGQVFFRDIATGREALADTNFPPACSSAFWGNKSVVVKVPPSFTRGGTGALVPGAYAVRVVAATPGAPASNEVNFAVNTEPATPGICAVTPSVAPVGSEVLISGERFTSGPGTVTFFDHKNGTAAPWGDTQISSVIPTGALTGPMTLTPASHGRVSNGYLVQVRNCNDVPGLCRSGETCCGDGSCRANGQCAAAAQTAMFAWRSSTGVIPRAPRVVEECRAGEIPSPAPWSNRSGGDSACVNATITMRFTTRLEPSSIVPSVGNVKVERCTGEGSDACATTEAVSLASGSPRLLAANGTQDYLAVNAASAFEPATTYRVVLTTGVRGLGAEGTNMIENPSRCGAGNAYCFTFTTRNDATPCAIGAVEVSPDPYTAAEQGRLPVDHAAVPLAQGDSCTVLQCEAYDWNWDVSDGRASITNDLDYTHVPAHGACIQRATAQLETQDDPVKVLASTAGVTGSADLYIKFLPPRVERFGPNCDTACINAAAWAVLNTELDPASVNTQNVTIQRCVNENCLETDPPLPLTADSVKLVPVAGSQDTRLRQIDILPLVNGTPMLLPGRFYKVTLRGGFQDGIRSRNQVPLTGLNDPEGFAWTFRVKPGDAGLCKVDRIVMAPTEKYETRVGMQQGFQATPFSAADTCAESGQQLIALGGFSWASSKPEVAVLLQNGQMDTGAPLPPGCSGRCTYVGASGPAGSTSRCGNTQVEKGEECDDGNAENADACSNTCLWNPIASVTQGGTCGNGRLDAGEDCDVGRVCRGAPANSTTPNGYDCTLPQNEALCTANSGTCAPAQARGCSPTCRHLGSSAGNSTCGNGDIADGEDCDDGNVASGDGCSADCLKEGSSRNVYALCGNGVSEPGEACERTPGGSWPADGCDVNTCLHTGVRPCTTPNEKGICCGNNNASQPGKDCDDGNTRPGDGCSATCLLEGSSAKYDLPSFCSDGVLDVGEQCEASTQGGDGRVDGFQIAQIVGEGDVNEKGQMSSELTAKLDDSASGKALYGLQCGFADERSCSDDPANYSTESGLTTYGCCDTRPRVEDAFPLNGGTGVCRNALISGSFNVEMDADSLSPNFVVAKRVQGDVCPEGMTDVTDAMKEAPRGFRGFFTRMWNGIRSFFGAKPALAERWCSGGVSGKLASQTVDGKTTFSFTLENALDARTEYRVRFLGDASTSTDPLGDNADPSKRTGVRSKHGVVVPQDAADFGRLTWHFTTGDDICRISGVTVRDLTDKHPYFYAAAEESHPFVAHANAVVGGIRSPLSPTAQYAWQWQEWVFSNPNIIRVEPAVFPPEAPRTDAVTSRDARSRSTNGSGYLSARVRVTADTGRSSDAGGSTVGEVIQGTAHLTVNVCEHPWPALVEAPFRDEQGSPSLKGTSFANGPFFNFSMSYCRDAGAAGPNEDLPGLITNAAPSNAADSAQGILRQYLFTFRENALQKDGIGVRIAANPMHLSPLEWYRSKGFTGNPQAFTVDGYEAIRDGRTVYVSAVNTDGPDGKGSTDLYSNIYLISYNEGAEQLTRQIYDHLLESLSFNTNIAFDVAGVCQDAAGSIVAGSNGVPATCSADWECDKFGDGNRCANFKGKLQRDLIRLGNLQTMSRALESSKGTVGVYPTLGSGSYLPGLTTSRWPSWNDAFRSALTIAPPVDPVNRFVTCGRCSPGNTACVADSDCGSGGTCVAQEGYDAATCWNSDAKAFRCPAIVPQSKGGDVLNPSQSRLYAYRALQAGQRFELATDLEVPPYNTGDLTSRWWKPPLFEQIKQCVTVSETNGNFCITDNDCRVCPAGNCAGVAAPVGACRAMGGQFRYTDICRGGATFGSTGSCGDGVLDVDPTHLSCLGGSRDGAPCTDTAQCGAGGTCSPNEICELTGPTATRAASCTADGNAPGQKQQRCLDCRRYADDTSHPGCFANKQCGNGRKDGVCWADRTRVCSTNADCAGLSGMAEYSTVCDLETCDDGVLNGTYGRCNLTCSGTGAYCGDGMISPGETCDLGTENGQRCSAQAPTCNKPTESCNMTCTGPAPFCGDGIVDAGEVCDGNQERTSKAICSTGTRQYQPCDSNTDCGAGGRCGGSGFNACPVGQERVRSCDAYMYAWATTCNWGGGNTTAGWGPCRSIAFCGNGVVEGDEQCDDGNSENEDACTASCKKNVCGDAKLYKGVEDCDMGDQNGEACTSSEYGATCSSCSTSCKYQLTQGGYCGDGLRQGTEQCDKTDMGNGPGRATSITCTALGYDYASSAGISCASSCQFSGCAYCGSEPGDGAVEGVLIDTLFQQPVPGARVALFYRGLQVNVTTADDNGYFSMTGLDDQSACNQYRLVVDAYADNPKTTTFNEATRGGYFPVSVGPFASNPDALAAAVESAKKGVTTIWNNREMAQISMVPRLGDGEYVVQLWWNPSGGYNGMLRNFQKASNKNTFYASKEEELVDLIVRMPFTYDPRTNDRCSLDRQPQPYNPTVDPLQGRNLGRGEDGQFHPDTMYQQWRLGRDGVDQANAINGMYTCTNKIRASFSRTCANGEVDDAGLQGVVGCAHTDECRNYQTYNHGLSSSSCTSAIPEPSRQGDIRVLSGREGAYLFCYHPEWRGIDENEFNSSDCGNFILPPQSVFISGRTGAYEMLVSRYRLFTEGSHDPASIRQWLDSRNGELRVYDKTGFLGAWNPEEIENGARSPLGNRPTPSRYPESSNGWNTQDAIEGDRCGLPIGWIDNNKDLYYTYAHRISPIWTPLAIDTSNKRIIEFNAGYYGADFRYFSDIPNRTSWLYDAPGGSGKCWERTCARIQYDGGETLPPTNVCTGAGYSASDARVACDTTTKNSSTCREGSRCETDTPNDDTTCIQRCTEHSDCTKPNSFCGGRGGTCGSASRPPASR